LPPKYFYDAAGSQLFEHITALPEYYPTRCEMSILRAHGRDIVTAATTAANLRFRAVMMTSFAFIMGLIPLVIAGGAGAATQRAVGTAVFGGMLAASFLGIFVIPGLYVAFQSLREKLKGMTGTATRPQASSASDGHSP